ncbi:putative trancriptional regulator, ArsR family [Halalkaliarchaeum sp. AArc-CO]|uniref:DUF7344 domain-containing protein n=1 Tax=unclassified Halalkaliarchaeum TaxID=2678344 RepID=UPI00217D83A0|nr:MULTISPECIES: hypothetical protein [unclassified Halalkaliarchaeum]MDR5671568.1 hypothetical protein [Halalkaliarchaeum sp. AArc-GB]UWG51068.1 putative trancriptional regulator, ArsR family [Halalkaliarchaeum sp. AArc-CO]
MQLRTTDLPESQIHAILSNPRRTRALRHLYLAGGSITVNELSHLIAEHETGESPPPKNVRESVYISLHQTHLPKLHDLEVVEYDRETKEIHLKQNARNVDLYMEVVTRHGITWSEFYQGLGILSLLTILASLLSVPGLSAIDPLLLTSGFLALFAVVTLYQLWTNRWFYLSTTG